MIPSTGKRTAAHRAAPLSSSSLSPCRPAATLFFGRGKPSITSQQHQTSTSIELPAHRLGVPVLTSEFWYEEEDEFDSVTDVLVPKRIFLLTPPVSSGGETPYEGIRRYLQPLSMQAAFSSFRAIDVAEAAWKGRDGPPYFLKVRAEEVLDKLADGESCHGDTADNFWQMLCGINWRTDLDAGLPGAVAPTFEALLVVVDRPGAQVLLNAVQAPSSALDLPDGTITVVRFKGSKEVDLESHEGETVPFWKLEPEVELSLIPSMADSFPVPQFPQEPAETAE